MDYFQVDIEENKVVDFEGYTVVVCHKWTHLWHRQLLEVLIKLVGSYWRICLLAYWWDLW